MNDIAIKIDAVSKTFKLPHEKYSSVKSIFVNFYKRKRTYELQLALNDVSFEVKKGEFFGIVGRNGSGKSTLLKLIAGIYAPSGGDIRVKGSLTPFIELGVGFNPELTGRENVFLNGSLFGFNRKAMLDMYKDIVKFAELEKFMDQKLKNYSSGMQVRLAFSIAIRVQSDILLLDEVLAVGDAAFQQKCYDYFTKLKNQKKTIVLVSHNMPIIEQYCDRAMLLEHGQIKDIGSSSEVASLYENMFIREEAARIKKERNEHQSPGNEVEAVKVKAVNILQGSKAVEILEAKKKFEVHVSVASKEDLDKVNIGINIKNRDRVMIFSTDTRTNIGDVSLPKKVEKTAVFEIENIFTNGLYTVNVGVADTSDPVHKVLLRQENAQQFTIEGIDAHVKSLTHPKVTAVLR